MKSIALLALTLALVACTHTEFSGRESMASGSPYGVGVWLERDLRVDGLSETLLRTRPKRLDASAWALAPALTADFTAEISARHGSVEALTPDPAALEKAAQVRESRWRKVERRQSQAVLDLWLAEAGRRGLRTLLVVTPLGNAGEDPPYPGSMGVACSSDHGGPDRAFVYFWLDVTAWDVPARRKLWEREVDPARTKDKPIGDCLAVGNQPDLAHALEEPVKRTLAQLASDLLAGK